MFNGNRDGLDLDSDDVGLKLATKRTPAISGLAGTNRKFLGVIRRAL